VSTAQVVISQKEFDAVVFDLDGVVTQTSLVHAAAWKALFDSFLRNRAAHEGRDFVPFDGKVDYRLYVDGKPRYDGVHDFLASRGIELPRGEPSDPPELETVCGLGNRKNVFFNAEVREHGVKTYDTTVALLRQLRAAGLKTGLISSSKNTSMIMDVTGLGGLFDVRVDGVLSERLGLPGKPDPDVFLEAARRLGVDASRTAVVEDALSGVEAGHRGGFGLVIGVDRLGQAEALRKHGADVVVDDLAAVTLVE
jgi:beta-phosphoglucomutase family hydrolase